MIRTNGQEARAGGQSAQRSDHAVLEETSRRYEACHPDDTFSNLVRRSSLSKEDRRLLEDWLDATSLGTG